MLTASAFFRTPASNLTPAMEQEFFSSLMARNKTYKTTFHKRFEEINRYLVQEIKSGHMHAGSILDIGISSGISTVELYEELRSQGVQTKIVGTDILVHAYLVKVFHDCYAMVDSEGFPLRLDVFGRGMLPWVRSQDYNTGFFVIRKLINVIFAGRSRRILSRAPDSRIQNVKLVTPRLLSSDDIRVCRDDIAQYNPEFAQKFDLIRAANVMNKGYFSEEVLQAMLKNIRKYLSGTDSGLLIVRTHEDNVNHGTLFRTAENGHLEVVERFGAGSEIESMVLRL